MEKISSQIESLLFISARPMSARQIAVLTGGKEKDISIACEALVEQYQGSRNGIQIIRNSGKYQMVSAPENAGAVQKFIQNETAGELSRPSLEALTIIAYRGPVSKSDLDRIRGVNCSLILRNLLMRGLVEAKPDKVKEETYYGVTFDFIRFLGISDLSQLPDYERLSRDDSIDRVLAGAEGLDAPAGSADAMAPDPDTTDDEEI